MQYIFIVSLIFKGVNQFPILNISIVLMLTHISVSYTHLDVYTRQHPELPILYNANIGHALPIAVIPYGVRCRLDLDKKTFTLLEPCLLYTSQIQLKTFLRS